MKNLQIVKEYNNVSSNKNNMDVFDIYVNDWGVLQYGFKYNEFTKMHDLFNITMNKKFTGLTLEKMDKVIQSELDYQIELFRKAKRI